MKVKGELPYYHNLSDNFPNRLAVQKKSSSQTQAAVKAMSSPPILREKLHSGEYIKRQAIINQATKAYLSTEAGDASSPFTNILSIYA